MARSQYAQSFRPVRYCQHCGLSQIEKMDETLRLVVLPPTSMNGEPRRRWEHPSCAEKAEEKEAAL